MRFIEIKTLIEGNLAPAQLAKEPARLSLLMQKIKSGSPFTLQSGELVIVNKQELPRLQDLIDSGKFGGRIAVNTNLGVKGLGDFVKTREFGGTTAGSDTVDDPTKVSNIGNIAEGMLGSALFAKLASRVNGTIGEITQANLWAIIDTLKQTKSEEYTVNVKDAGQKAVTDRIIYILKLNQADYRDLMNPEKRAVLAKTATSCVKFVNSKLGDEYAKHFYLNGKPDIIKVVTDGLSDQKGRKTDVEVSVTDATTGKQSEKVLNLSLKAGASQFGQVGAGTMKPGKGQRTPIQSAVELFGRLGVDVSNLEQVYHDTWTTNPNRAVEGMYKAATGVLEQILRGDNDSAEYKVVKYLTDFINHHATLGDPSVLLVSLAKGDYEVSSFAKLEPELEKIDLAARYRTGLSNPQIDIYDANDPQSSTNSTKPILFSVRFKPGTSGSKHLILGGGLLKKLTSVKEAR